MIAALNLKFEGQHTPNKGICENSTIQTDNERPKYAVLPFANDAKFMPTYFSAISGALWDAQLQLDNPIQL